MRQISKKASRVANFRREGARGAEQTGSHISGTSNGEQRVARQKGYDHMNNVSECDAAIQELQAQLAKKRRQSAEYGRQIKEVQREIRRTRMKMEARRRERQVGTVQKRG